MEFGWSIEVKNVIICIYINNFWKSSSAKKPVADQQYALKRVTRSQNVISIGNKNFWKLEHVPESVADQRKGLRSAPIGTKCF
jgi:hypothetical protein